MKILIIGFGSIGKRHFEILNTYQDVDLIHIVTKQTVQNIISFESLNKINDLTLYDYFIISSETIKHYEQLNYICSKVSHKKILVEKPLFNKKYKDINTTNQIFTAYNLRFHPVLNKLYFLLKKEQVYYANILCGQYLPTWRPEQDYRNTYSADLSKGGGVLRDLSHELDYLTWLFGDIENIHTINTKISDLEINSDDIFTAVGMTRNKTIINVTIDYISKTPIRQLIIHTKEKTIKADVIKNTISISDKNSNTINLNIDTVDRNHTYGKMHRSIINNQLNMVCSFNEGKKIIDIIDGIKFKELSNEKI